MADDVRALLLQIDANTALLRSNVAQAEQVIANFQRETDHRLDQVNTSFGRLGDGASKLRASLLQVTAIGGGVLGVLGVASGVSALAEAARRALDYASSLDEVAQQLGVTSEQLQVYRYAASQVGVSQEQLEQGLGKLTRTIGEAATGSDKAQKVFDALGVKILDAGGNVRSTGDLIPRIADALQKIEDPAKRAAVEVDLFGKAGQRLDNLLSGGSAALDQLTTAARDLGIVLDKRLIENADAAADKISELKQVLEARLAVGVAENAQEIYRFVDAAEQIVLKIPAAIRTLREWGLTAGAIQARFAQNLTFGLVGKDLEKNIRTEQRRIGEQDYISEGETHYRNAMGVLSRGMGSFDPLNPFGSGSHGGVSVDNLNAGSSRGRARREELSDLEKALIDLQREARNAGHLLDKIEFVNPDKITADAARKFYSDQNIDVGGDYDRMLKQIEGRADEKYASERYDLEQENELQRVREGHVRELAYLTEDLFEGGNDRLWKDFKRMGLEAAAEIVARLLVGQSLQSALGSTFSMGGNGAGSALSSIFGGAFADGGMPPIGKVSLVGERGPELFVPKVPGTILPNGSFGGTSVTFAPVINAPGATAETVAMIRRELAAVAPEIVRVAQSETIKQLNRGRL